MHLILLVFLWWPFHHKHVPVEPIGVQTALGLIHFPDSYCPHSDDGYLFLGPDGMVGISKESCDAAFTDWNKNTGAPPVLNQI